MRILIESPNCNAFAGSNGAVGYGWVSRLAGRHEVHVVTYGDIYARGDPPAVAGLHVISVAPTRRARLGSMSDFVLGARKQRDDIIARVKPDIVHSLEPGGWNGMRALATDAIPYVMGPLAGGAVEHPRAFSAAVLSELPISPARQLFSGGVKKFGVRMWNEVLFGNLPTAHRAAHTAMRKARAILLATDLESGAIPPGAETKTRRMPLMGIDPNLFAPHPRGTGPFTVLYAGRIVPIKCLHLLIDAVRRAPGVHLRIAGAAPVGEEWYERFCQERAVSIAERITWLGHISRDELAKEYGSADVACMLSLWDTYGLTYIEAMACGTPVIALAAGGAPEIVRPGTGWLVEPTDPDNAIAQLANRLEEAASDRPASAETGARARAFVEHTFGWPTLLDRLDGIYDSVIDI